MHALSAVVAQWASFYQGSTAAQVAIQFSHIGGLMIGGGLAVASDRAVLREPRPEPQVRARLLADLHGVHRAVIMALGVVVVSGLLFFAADVDTFATSWLFWAKVSCVALLLANGARIVRLEGRAARQVREERPWRRLRHAAWLSVTLWLLTTLLGTVLVNAS